MYHYSYGLIRKVAIYKCTCVCKCLSLSIYFQSYNSFPPVSIYCAYYLFMYVQFSCCPLRALNWSINWIELNCISKRKCNWIQRKNILHNISTDGNVPHIASNNEDTNKIIFGHKELRMFLTCDCVSVGSQLTSHVFTVWVVVGTSPGLEPNLLCTCQHKQYRCMVAFNVNNFWSFTVVVARVQCLAHWIQEINWLIDAFLR